MGTSEPDLPQLCYRMNLAYDGTEFSGWQVQPNGVTIQELVEKALAVLLKYHVTVLGAGRTDSGVHALEQVAHFHSREPLDTFRIIHALNGILPHAIRVLTLEPAPAHFHARYSAIGKEYHYFLTLNRTQNPFHRLYRWHVRHRMDLEALRLAAQQFIGRHDFTSFANETHKGSASKDAVRTLWRLDVVPDDEGVRLEFDGEGFLYKMVRNIVGTLVEVGDGKRPVEDIARLLQARDRRLAGQAAPSHGLFLVKVRYPDEL